MNHAQRIGLIGDLHRVYVLAGERPLTWKERSNGEVRDLARPLGLLSPRTHSNANRNWHRGEVRRKALLAKRRDIAKWRETLRTLHLREQEAVERLRVT